MSEEEKNEVPAKKSGLGLSVTQLVGGSAAAATAAVLGARLGTTGTIIGAALVSLVSAVASAIYTASLRRTQEVVARTKEILPTTITWRSAQQDLPEVAEQVAEEGVEEATPSLWSRVSWKAVGLYAGAFFLITAVVITGFELVTGRSVDGGKGTTVSQATHGGRKPSNTPAPTPTTEPTKKASSSSGSSTPTASDTPTGSTSVAPTPTTSTSPSPTPTSSASSTPTASPTQ